MSQLVVLRSVIIELIPACNGRKSKLAALFRIFHPSMKRVCLALVLLVFQAGNAFAQLEIESAEAETMLHQGISGGIGIHNTGWFIGARYFLNKSGDTDWLMEFDFSRNKHPKEFRNPNTAYINARPFVFGKLNDYFNVRLGGGQIRTLYDRSEKNGVEVRWNYSGGLTLALLKPVYLDFIYANPGDPNVDVRSERATYEKFFTGQIYGASDFSSGLNQISLQPGAYLKTGLIFDFASFNDDIRFLECGVTVDAYAKPVEIMAIETNSSIFVSFYVGLQFGGRW